MQVNDTYPYLNKIILNMCWNFSLMIFPKKLCTSVLLFENVQNLDNSVGLED